jgi:hypothetical protein
MNTIRRIRHSATFLAGLAAALACYATATPPPSPWRFRSPGSETREHSRV